MKGLAGSDSSRNPRFLHVDGIYLQKTWSARVDEREYRGWLNIDWNWVYWIAAVGRFTPVPSTIYDTAQNDGLATREQNDNA